MLTNLHINHAASWPMSYFHSTSTITKPLKMSYILFSAQKKSLPILSPTFMIFFIIFLKTLNYAEKENRLRESLSVEKKGKKINAM